jgi:hypothetical protein
MFVCEVYLPSSIPGLDDNSVSQPDMLSQNIFMYSTNENKTTGKDTEPLSVSEHIWILILLYTSERCVFPSVVLSRCLRCAMNVIQRISVLWNLCFWSWKNV